MIGLVAVHINNPNIWNTDINYPLYGKKIIWEFSSKKSKKIKLNKKSIKYYEELMAQHLDLGVKVYVKIDGKEF